jgi:glycosyl transferase family 25
MKCYVINLEREKERLESIRKLFDGVGIPFRRVEAVDARRMDAAERRAVCPPFRFYLANAFRPAVGEIGCTLSHIKAWREAFSGGEPLAAVFEDDATFDAAGLRAAFASIERENDPAVPTAWLLHKGLPRPAETKGDWYDILETDDIGHVFCVLAYVLNAAAARRLEAILTPKANVIDTWSVFARCGVRVLAAASPCATDVKFPSANGWKKDGLWRHAWYRRFHWFRWRLALHLDLFLKRFEGKRYSLGDPA